MNALNPRLYAQLAHAFKRVRVTKAGEPMRVRPTYRYGKRSSKIEIQDWGETYKVNCPYCKDSRYRLNINHRWAPPGSQDTTMSHTYIHCFNEHCPKNRDFMPRFLKLIEGRVNLSEAVIAAADTDSIAVRELPWPGDCIPVHELPEEHAAVRYIRDVRKLDVEELGRDWEVSWCMQSKVLPSLNRLFVPMFDFDADGKRILVGGQAHWLDLVTLTGTPPKHSGYAKWFTLPGTRTSKTLFNAWRAKEKPGMVVVTEAPFSAMRLGSTDAVALFGHNLGLDHRETISKYWGNGVCVIWLDEDVNNDKTVSQQVFELRSMCQTVVRIKPTDGRDAADMSRTEALDIIGRAIAANGKK